MTRLRRPLSAIVALLAGGLAVAPAAEAATISVARPTGGKVSVSWPVSTAVGTTPTVVAPGAKLQVAVRQTARGSHPVTVSFSPATKNAPGARSKTLRKGVFNATVSTTTGDRYTLKLRSGKHTVRTSVVAVGALPPAPDNGALPTSTPAPLPTIPPNPCGTPEALSGTLAAAVSVPTTKYFSRAGYDLPDIIHVSTTVTNTGTSCFGPPSAVVERFVDGVWTEMKQPTAIGTPAVWFSVAPGQTSPVGWFFHADEPAGDLRVRVQLDRGTITSTAPRTITLHAPFAWSGVSTPSAG